MDDLLPAFFIIIIVVLALGYLGRIRIEARRTNKLLEGQLSMQTAIDTSLRRANELLESIAKNTADAARPDAPSASAVLFKPGVYYYSKTADRVEGPFTTPQIEKFFKQGKVAWETPMREESDQEWTTAANHVSVS